MEMNSLLDLTLSQEHHQYHTNESLNQLRNAFRDNNQNQ